MSRYDGLIIPRSYSEYINKTDAATLAQALQLANVLSGTVQKGDSKAVKSSAVFDAIALLSHKQIRYVGSTPGKDITSYFSDGTIYKRLAGTDGYKLFEDIYVGDYFQMSRAITCPNSYQGEAGTKWVTIADIDGAYGRGDSSLVNYHHLICVPGKGAGMSEKQHFGRARMYPSNQTYTTDNTADAGGYKASEMFTTTIGDVVSAGSTASGATINQQLYAEFGSHLKTTRELVSNKVTSTLTNNKGGGIGNGAASGSGWVSAQAILMSEIECYGSVVWSSSGYDTGSACKPLALFQQLEQARNNRTNYYWLRDIASAAFFCFSSSRGSAYYGNASDANSGVRPRFIIA